MTLLRSGMVAGLAGLGLVAAATPSGAEGLFDFLFGGFAPQPRYEYPAARAPLDVQVNPRRRKPENAGPVSAIANGPKPLLQKSIDPVATPNWHLADPTLRRGDIVVLKSGVYVFDGNRHAPSNRDFTAIGQSALVSKGERDRIENMAGSKTTRAHPAEEKDATPKQASLATVTR